MIVTGTSGDDYLEGSSSADSLFGGDGDDTLHGGKGADTLDGGANGPYGDTACYSDSTNPVTANLKTGIASDGRGSDTLVNIENLIGGINNDFLQGDAADNRFTPGAGDDTVNGDEGFDQVIYATSPSAVSVTLGGTALGQAQDGYGGVDTLSSIESVQGSSFNDTLRGSDSGLFESFEGLAGNDSINGLGGIDRASYENSPGAVLVNLATGTASDGWGGTDTLQNIEDVLGSVFNDTLIGSAGSNDLDGGDGDDSIAGGDGDDMLRGGAGNDTLDGGAGDDTLDGGAGDDTLDGGAGNDTAVFAWAFAAYGISVDSATGDLIVSGPEGTDTLRNIEQLQFADTTYAVVQGTSEADTLTGGADSDLIRGGGGDDTLLGGDGDDALYGDEGDDDLDGGEGNDLLDGGTGADRMAGGNGDDTYVVDDEGDVVLEAGGALAIAPADGRLLLDVGGGIDKVIASINYTLGSFVENLDLAGAAGLSGTGNALANVLTGNAGDNMLAGQGGNDQIDGGAGIDTAVYAAQRSQYSLSVGTSSTQVNDTSGQEGTDTLVNIERLQFSDVNVALDLSGNAGEVAKILGAVFGKASVDNELYVGIGLDLADGGMAYEALMQLALEYRLGPDATNHTAAVQLLYENVVGFAPSPDQLGLFVGLLDDGTYTIASLAVMAADHSYNLSNIDFAGLAQTGLEYI